ncbi:hypothetical protein Q361_1572 [Flavobacterium croceum DSM 17960]|uniref:Uncharacterized protein n=1 Tax=Flavobacterium croceum DSM 17960 TaxID=1121886 RepID=A0A2S4N4B5_9FLAO|nr:hypothetical protein [Flavobacterium croceum]POS00568.1 hypothetical protein Q361_1572 [Flavobacterium croceum DSM 17960]
MLWNKICSIFEKYFNFNMLEMATTIRITPTLSGKASKQFNTSLSKNSSIKVSASRRESMSVLVKKVLSNKK